MITTLASNVYFKLVSHLKCFIPIDIVSLYLYTVVLVVAWTPFLKHYLSYSLYE